MPYYVNYYVKACRVNNFYVDDLKGSKATFLFTMHNCNRGATPTPPKTCSNLKIHFSAPNHRTDMKLFVNDPNTSKNEWNLEFVSFLKIGRKGIKNKFVLFAPNKIGLKK